MNESIRESLKRVSQVYGEYRTNKVTNEKHEAHDLIVNQIPKLIREKIGIDKNSELLVKGSTGAGNITLAPWVGLFDKRITSTAQEGYYVVFLFSLDLERVYLSLAFGATQFTRQYGKNKLARTKMQEAAEKIRILFPVVLETKLLGEQPDLHGSVKKKSTTHLEYEASCIFSLPAYALNNLPLEEELIDDIGRVRNIYRDLIESPIVPDVTKLLEDSIETVDEEAFEFDVSDFHPVEKKKRQGTGNTSGGNRRSNKSTKVGRAGEEHVLRYEAQKLRLMGENDIDRYLIPHYKRNEFPGYDLTSLDEEGKEVYIEVKSSVSKTIGALELTPNEWSAAQRLGDMFLIYLVTNALTKPKIQIIRNPLSSIESGVFRIEPSAFQLDIRNNAD